MCVGQLLYKHTAATTSAPTVEAVTSISSHQSQKPSPTYISKFQQFLYKFEISPSQDMGDNLKANETMAEEEEYVLLDLDAVCGQVNIPPNAPYVLSGLDTLNPILVIGDDLKLVGEYEETIGTCYVFTETDSGPVVHEETGPSEVNLFRGTCIVDESQEPKKEVKPIASLHKILKFRLSADVDDTPELVAKFN